MKNQFVYGLAASVMTILSSCATGPKLAPEQRVASFVIEHPGLLKNDAYVRSSSWIAKTFRSAKAVIQVQDKDSGKTVGRGYARCDSVRQALDVNHYQVGFTLDITNKDQKSRLMFEDVAIFLETDMSPAMVNIADSDDMTKVKNECLSPMANELRAALTSKSKDDF